MPRDITVTFADGSKHVYRAAPDDLTPQQVTARAQKEFGKQVKALDGGRKDGNVKVPPVLSELGRQVGLTGRYIAEGLADVGGIATNAINAPIDYALSKTGTKFRFGSDLSGAVSEGLTRAGVPKPRTGTEKVIGELSKAVVSTAPFIKAGTLLTKAARPVSRAVGGMLAKGPGYQATGNVVGAASAMGAKALGAPVPIQVAAGMLGGSLVPSSGAGIKEASGVVKRYVKGDAVREATGRLLLENTDNVDDVLTRIDDMVDGVSGAKPTLAEVTRDSGIAGLQRSLGDVGVSGGAKLSERMGSNAIARLGGLTDNLGQGDPDAIKTAAFGLLDQSSQRLGNTVQTVGDAVSPQVAGENIRGVLATRANAAKQAARRLYDNLPDGELPVQLRPLEADDVLPPNPIDQGRVDFEASRRVSLAEQRPGNGDSLLSFIRRNGGLKPGNLAEGGANMRGELHDGRVRAEMKHLGMTNRTHPTLINRNGQELDRMRELAAEAGYLSPDTTEADLINLIDRELKGSPVFSQRNLNDSLAQREFDVQQTNLAREMDHFDFDPANASPEDWDNYYLDAMGRGPRSVTVDDLGGGQGRLSGPLQSTLSDLRQQFYGDDMPAEIKRLFARVMNTDQASLRDVEQWEKQARNIAGRSANRAEAAYANAIGDAIGGFLRSASTPERRTALRAAQDAWRNQARTFGEDEVGATLRQDRFDRAGEYSLDEGAVPGRLVQPGPRGEEVASRLVRAAGDAPAQQLVRTEMRRELDAAGNNLAAIQRIQEKYSGALSRFPEIGRDVENARGMATVDAALRRSSLGRMAGEMVDPAAEVSKMLNSQGGRRRFEQLASQLSGSRDGIAGLRRTLAMHIERSAQTSAVNASGDRVPSSAAMLKSLDNILETSRGTSALTVAQRNTLEAIREELAGAQFAATANRTQGSSTARNATVGARIAKWGARAAAAQAGGLSLFDLARNLFDNTADIHALAVEAVLDPKLAAELMRKGSQRRAEDLADMVKAGTLGATVGTARAVEP